MSDDRKKSWREIDRQRDSSDHRKPERGAAGRPRGSRKSYKAALDRLFDSGKIGDVVKERAEQTGCELGGEDAAERNALARAVQDAVTPSALASAADAYLKRFDMPQDIELLAKMLELRDEERQVEVMESIVALDAEARPRRLRAVIGQLKLIRDMNEEDRASELARELLGRFDG